MRRPSYLLRALRTMSVPFKNDGRIGKEAFGPHITKNAILFGANDFASMKHDLIADL